MYYINRFHIPEQGIEKDWPVVWLLKEVHKPGKTVKYWELVKKINDPMDAFKKGDVHSFREGTVVNDKELIIAILEEL